MRSLFLHILPVILLLLAASCSKDNALPPVKEWLMTVNFSDDYINPQLQAIVFVSDRNGKPLADTLVSGNPTVRLYATAAFEPPVRVTIVRWEPDMHNFRVTLETFNEVFPSTWTLAGNRLVSAGDATVSLADIPGHTGPILYGLPGHTNLTFSGSGVTLPLFTPPSPLYVALNTPEGPMYRFTEPLTPGNHYEINMLELLPAATQNIRFSGPVVDFHLQVYGYADTVDRSSLPVVADEQLGDGTPVSEVRAAYPPGRYASCRTTMKAVESFVSPDALGCSFFGSIPSGFRKIGARVEQVTVAGITASIAASGAYTVSAATWQYGDTANLVFDWTIFGSDTATTLSLPGLPATVRKMFPTLAADSLRYFQTELTDYNGLSDYQAYLYRRFMKPGAGGMERVDRSSVSQIFSTFAAQTNRLCH